MQKKLSHGPQLTVYSLMWYARTTLMARVCHMIFSSLTGQVVVYTMFKLLLVWMEDGCWCRVILSSCKYRCHDVAVSTQLYDVQTFVVSKKS